MSTAKTKKNTKPARPAKPTKPPALVATVSRETLEDTPDRVLPFLRAIGTTPAIHALMARRGYGAEEHQEGWSLLHAVSGFAEDKPLRPVDNSVRDAIITLDNWDEDGFRIVRASLSRRHSSAPMASASSRWSARAGCQGLAGGGGGGGGGAARPSSENEY